MRVQATPVKARKWSAFAFVASVEAAAAGEPGHGAFHGPAVAAQPLRGLDSLAGDAVGNGLSRRFAAEIPMEMGRPDRSVIRWIFEPYLPPVGGIWTCQVPLLRARMFTESIAHRDQSRSPRAPSSSRTRRWSLAHTRALDHSENRRWAVAPDGPNDAEGSCCQVQPDVATNTIAASTSRSPCWRRSPPWVVTAPPAPPAGTTPTTRPAPAAQRSPPWLTEYRVTQMRWLLNSTPAS